MFTKLNCKTGLNNVITKHHYITSLHNIVIKQGYVKQLCNAVTQRRDETLYRAAVLALYQTKVRHSGGLYQTKVPIRQGAPGSARHITPHLTRAYIRARELELELKMGAGAGAVKCSWKLYTHDRTAANLT